MFSKNEIAILHAELETQTRTSQTALEVMRRIIPVSVDSYSLTLEGVVKLCSIGSHETFSNQEVFKNFILNTNWRRIDGVVQFDGFASIIVPSFNKRTMRVDRHLPSVNPRGRERYVSFSARDGELRLREDKRPLGSLISESFLFKEEIAIIAEASAWCDQIEDVLARPEMKDRRAARDAALS